MIPLLFFRKISLKTVVTVTYRGEIFNSIELAGVFWPTDVVDLAFVWFVVADVAASMGDLLYCAHFELWFFGDSCDGKEEDSQG